MNNLELHRKSNKHLEYIVSGRLLVYKIYIHSVEFIKRIKGNDNQ